MPPSGYSIKQIMLLREFLQSCASALQAEAKDANESPMIALSREINGIGSALENEAVTEAQSAVLRMTRKFYQLVRERQPASWEQYSRALEPALDQLSDEVRAVKVASYAS